MTDAQAFLKQLDSKLWTAADKLRANLDAAVYKHAVLGLIFLKYVSDAFEMRQQQDEAQLRDEDHDYFLNPAEFKDEAEHLENIHQELEVRDHYVEENEKIVSTFQAWKRGPVVSGKALARILHPKVLSKCVMNIRVGFLKSDFGGPRIACRRATPPFPQTCEVVNFGLSLRLTAVT